LALLRIRLRGVEVEPEKKYVINVLWHCVYDGCIIIHRGYKSTFYIHRLTYNGGAYYFTCGVNLVTYHKEHF
jgi:hypothetical protein